MLKTYFNLIIYNIFQLYLTGAYKASLLGFLDNAMFENVVLYKYIYNSILLYLHNVSNLFSTK